MTDTLSLSLIAKSTEDMIEIGRKLGASLKGNEVIELVSDLGSGKTTLVKGIAKGAGSSELVSSPSFTICNEYPASKFTTYHFDFYRLNDPGIVRRELEEVISTPKTVTIIEWPEVIENVLPKNRVIVEISTAEDDSRQVKINYPETHKYLIKDMK